MFIPFFVTHICTVIISCLDSCTRNNLYCLKNNHSCIIEKYHVVRSISALIVPSRYNEESCLPYYHLISFYTFVMDVTFYGIRISVRSHVYACKFMKLVLNI